MAESHPPSRGAGVRAKAVVLLLPIIVLVACGSSYPVYPGAQKVAKDFGDKDAGTQAMFACTSLPGSRLNSPGGEVRLHPHSYKTSDSLESVKNWYAKAVADWERQDFAPGGNCEGGVYYVRPRNCTRSKGDCLEEMYIFGQESGGSWIVVWTR